jgi:hypothetical protein
MLILNNEGDKRRAKEWIDRAPKWSEITFKSPKRSNPQNSRQWAMLSVISDELTWYGQRYDKEAWRDFFMHLYRGERWMPGDEGMGMVPIGRSSSKLTKTEHSEFTTIIEAFAAKHGIDLGGVDGGEEVRVHQED